MVGLKLGRPEIAADLINLATAIIPNGVGKRANFFKVPLSKENKTMPEWEPKIVAFLCNWCSYGAADLAGVGRMEYPANIRVVRIPCTGRMDPKFFLAALREGADGVWVSG